VAAIEALYRAWGRARPSDFDPDRLSERLAKLEERIEAQVAPLKPGDDAGAAPEPPPPPQPAAARLPSPADKPPLAASNRCNHLRGCGCYSARVSG
jgi:hypothetical protein